MTTTLDVASDSAIELARECLYRFFAAALGDPRGPGQSLLADPNNRWLAGVAADVIRTEAADDPVPLDFGERPVEYLDLFDLLAELRRPADELAAEYDRVFGLVAARECQPYETEYCPTEEPFYRSQQMADVAGFYRAFGVTSGRARPDRPDHVAFELEFMAHLLQKQRLADDGSAEGAERAAVCADAARRFFGDHLAWWVPSYATALRRRAGSGAYAALATALAAFLPAERARLGIKAPQAPVRPRGVEPANEEAGCAGCAVGA